MFQQNHNNYNYTVSQKKRPLAFLYISENCGTIFVIFGMHVHHPNGSRKWLIKHSACILTAGVHNDDVIVTSVIMPFVDEDKHVIS